MFTYEVMYIVKVIEDEAFKKVVDYINNVIADNYGEVTKTDIWGKKRLAYEIQDCTEGLYVLVTFDGSPECVKELDRKIRINENILRHMIIRKS